MISAPNVTGVRLGRVVLSIVAMTIVVITLSPFHFSLDTLNPVSYAWTSYDAVMNVIMFVPIGFIYQLSRRSGIRAGWGKTFLAGAVLSALLELTQVFEPNRYPSIADLAMNTLGAGCGGALAIVAFGRADAAKAVRAFAVELPLMGIVYLLVPLAWLVASGVGGTARGWCVLPLALSAGWIIGAVFTSFERAPHRVWIAMTVWVVVALAPTAIDSVSIAVVAVTVGFAASFARSIGLAWITTQRKGAERRFEASTLRVVLPVLCIYLIWSSLTPAASRPEWLGFIALFRSTNAPANVTIFRAVEHIMTFTLIGYAIAEYGGRVREQFRPVVASVLVFATIASAVLEVLRGGYTPFGASATMFALTLVGAGLGGWLYVLQLAHVRALIRSAREEPTGTDATDRPHRHTA